MRFALETKALEKQFGGLKVTRDLSLRIAQGARHAVIGPNGGRKTTVINLLTGVLKPNAGRILLEGSDITDLPVHCRVLRGLSRTFPDQPALRRSDPARDHRAGGVRTPRPWRQLVAADGDPRRRQHRDRGKPVAISPARCHERADRDAALRQAAPAGGSRSRSRQSRACYCSTNPPPAFPRASVMTSWPRLRRCRAMSRCC